MSKTQINAESPSCGFLVENARRDIISHNACVGNVMSSVSCQSRGREEEKSVQHLLDTGAERLTEIRRRQRQKWGGFSVNGPRNWMFKN